MNEHTTPGTTTDLNWLVDGLADKTGAQHVVLLSADGLLKAYSGTLNQDDAEALAAHASGVQGLARSGGVHFGGGAPQQTIMEWENAYLLVTVAGEGACLAVLRVKDDGVDISVVAYEVNMTIRRLDDHLKTPARPHGTDGTPTS